MKNSLQLAAACCRAAPWNMHLAWGHVCHGPLRHLIAVCLCRSSCFVLLCLFTATAKPRCNQILHLFVKKKSVFALASANGMIIYQFRPLSVINVVAKVLTVFQRFVREDEGSADDWKEPSDASDDAGIWQSHIFLYSSPEMCNRRDDFPHDWLFLTNVNHEFRNSETVFGSFKKTKRPKETQTGTCCQKACDRSTFTQTRAVFS